MKIVPKTLNNLFYAATATLFWIGLDYVYPANARVNYGVIFIIQYFLAKLNDVIYQINNAKITYEDSETDLD